MYRIHGWNRGLRWTRPPNVLQFKNVFRWTEVGNAELAVASFVTLGRSLTLCKLWIPHICKMGRITSPPSRALEKITGGNVCARWQVLSSQKMNSSHLSVLCPSYLVPGNHWMKDILGEGKPWVRAIGHPILLIDTLEPYTKKESNGYWRSFSGVWQHVISIMGEISLDVYFSKYNLLLSKVDLYAYLCFSSSPIGNLRSVHWKCHLFFVVRNKKKLSFQTHYEICIWIIGVRNIGAQFF